MCQITYIQSSSNSVEFYQNTIKVSFYGICYLIFSKVTMRHQLAHLRKGNFSAVSTSVYNLTHKSQSENKWKYLYKHQHNLQVKHFPDLAVQKSHQKGKETPVISRTPLRLLVTITFFFFFKFHEHGNLLKITIEITSCFWNSLSF